MIEIWFFILLNSFEFLCSIILITFEKRQQHWSVSLLIFCSPRFGVSFFVVFFQIRSWKIFFKKNSPDFVMMTVKDASASPINKSGNKCFSTKPKTK